MSKNKFELDTSADYDDMLGYVSEDNIGRGSLSDFLGEEKGEYKPAVRAKEKDTEFPEDWQHLFVNFKNFEDYTTFMNMIDSKPVPKLTKLIYEHPDDRVNIFSFLGDDE